MNALQAIIVAIVQGATELFPVSSLGHAVVLPALAHWNFNPRAPEFLPFLVMLHLGTAIALLGFFWRDWWMIGTGVLGFGTKHKISESRRVFGLIVIATIPAVAVGFFLEHFVRGLFASPLVAAVFLIVNGAMLLGAERLRTRLASSGEARAAFTLKPLDALIIGCWQCLALIPGISRSGATIAGALLRGVGHEGAAHFSFLIALPVILGATVLEVPKLLHADAPPGTFSIALLGAMVAGITAFLSTAFLMRWFRGHDNWALDPFAWYCAALGGISLLVLMVT
jgi:undecaprenyl-diphosphatase